MLHFKVRAQRFLAPFVRMYIRYEPWSAFKDSLYRRLGWIIFSFDMTTIHGLRLSGNSRDTIQSRISFFGPKTNMGSASTTKIIRGNSEAIVEIAPLSTIIRSHDFARFHFIKTDAEGAEVSVY